MTWFRSNLLSLVALAAAVVFGLLWWHARSAAAEARRGQEAAQLEAQGVLVAHEATEAQLRDQVDSMARANIDFGEALRQALAAAHGAKVVTVITGSTGPVVAGTPSSAPAPAPTEPSPAPSCLLRPGDRGQIDVTAAELRTEAGNRVLVEAAEASRVEADGSKIRLFGGELRSDLTKYLSTEVKPEPGPGWGLGPAGHCAVIDGKAACGLGAEGVIPLSRHFDLTLQLTALGMPSAGAAVLWRP